MQWPTPALFALTLATSVACSGMHEKPREYAAGARATRRVPAVLDLPALLGLSVDGLAKQLGPAQHVPEALVDPTLSPDQIRAGVRDSSALFRRDGLRLLATYNYRTRHVYDLVVLGADEDSLMQRAHLQPVGARYLVLPVFQQRYPTQLFGLRVVPTEEAQ